MKQEVSKLHKQIQDFSYYIENRMDYYYEKGKFCESEALYYLLLKYNDFFHPFEEG